MSINSVVISGNLTRDAEIRRTSSGAAVTRFCIANNERRKNASGEWENYANYFDCVMFGTYGERMAEFLRKGKLMTVQGKLRYSTWETDSGEKRSKIEIIVEEIQLPAKPSTEPETVSSESTYDDIPF